MVSTPPTTDTPPDGLNDVLASVHQEVSGPDQGPPVLLLHGWGSHAQNMRPIAQALASDYRVLNVDLPGHGRTPPPPHAWGVPEHAALVSALLDTHDLGRVTLLGHSNGGRIGLFMASHPAFSAYIERLVLVSPSGLVPPRSLKVRAKGTLARLLKAPFQLLPSMLREPGLDWLRHSLVWKALGSSDYRALQGVMRETFVKTVSFHVDEEIHRINVPVLVFWGDQDTAVRRVQMDRLIDRVPDAGLVVLDGAGHYGYLDDFHTFITTTRYFLEHTASS